MNTLNSIGKQFASALVAMRQRATVSTSAQKVHVVGAGRTLTSAYEQLRNAAEYTEEHLLLQRAIKRFYKRLFLSNNQKDINSSGEELVTELTLAGYLQNDSIANDTVRQLDTLAATYFSAYSHLQDQGRHQVIDKWTIDVLAVEAELIVSDHSKRDVFLQFAFDHFFASIDRESLFEGNMPDDYELSLYVAVHQALLKSDDATIRWALLKRFQQTPAQLEHYIQTNQKIDTLLGAKSSEKLFRLVDRRGASLRILWRMMNERDDMDALLSSQDNFLSAFETQVRTEYKQINHRVNNGIIKSVIFLIITKFLIGIAIEVPYDKFAHGSILWLPLIVNLLLPPVYMVLLRLTLTLPNPANTRALVDEVNRLFYEDEATLALRGRKKKQYGVAFNVAYGLVFIAIFGLVAWGLISIGFSIVHLLIFFVFFSTASFLGFRLSRIIRELEVVDSEQTGVSLVRDFLYLPFVIVGRWLSDKYSRVNFIAIILDMIIELPLKTVLRLIRQWGAFISTKKDEL